MEEMPEKLTKYERKLVSQGASRARRSDKAREKTARVLGLGAGLLAAKVDASGALSMTVPLPIIGETPISAVIGWPTMLAPLVIRNPGTYTQAGGMVGFALVCRSMK